MAFPLLTCVPHLISGPRQLSLLTRTQSSIIRTHGSLKGPAPLPHSLQGRCGGSSRALVQLPPHSAYSL